MNHSTLATQEEKSLAEPKTTVMSPDRGIAMKATELRGMSDEQLALTLVDTEKHLFQLRFQSATDRLETPSEMDKAKKDIARIKTLQRQRELAKLPGISDEVLTKAIADQTLRTEGPGKRKAKRSIVRLTALQDGRAASKINTIAAAPAKGK